jgi:hypothetical protein
MPITEGDVLDVLHEAETANVDFWIADIHVSSQSFGVIRDHIRVGNILVVTGTEMNKAKYDNQTDILITQANNPPLPLNQKALLVHECTHALVDVFNADTSVTRHMDELASYFAQVVFEMRKNPSYTTGPNNPPWYAFFESVEVLARANGLDTPSGNGKHLSAAYLEPLRWQLRTLPGVNYGDFGTTTPTGANGLARKNPFIESSPEPLPTKFSYSERDYLDVTDDYLIGLLLEQFSARDVAGYGGRIRALRRDFALCSPERANELYRRLSVKQPADRLSKLFYERLSHQGCAILVRVLKLRVH